MHWVMTQEEYKFFLLAVSTLTEAAKNVYSSCRLFFILDRLYRSLTRLNTSYTKPILVSLAFSL